MRAKYVSLFVVALIVMISLGLSQSVEAKDSLPPYIEGKEFGVIRQEILLNDSYYLAVSTEKNVYLLQDGLVNYNYKVSDHPLFIEVIPDLNDNGFDELLIMTRDREDNNIFLFDTKDQSLIDSFASKMTSFDPKLGFIEKIVTVTDYHIEDEKVIFVAGYNIFAKNLKTGKVLWQTKASNNMWDIEPIGDINNDQKTDYALALQPTNVMAISGVNGEIIYNKKVSEPVVIDDETTIETSIWNMQYDDVYKRIYASSENGSVYLLEASNGEIYRSQSIFSIGKDNFQRYSSESDSYLDPLYNKLTVELTEDISGDGNRDLIYYQNIRFDRFGSDSLTGNRDFESRILIIDGLTLKNTNYGAKLRNNVYGYNFFKGTYNDEMVAYILSDTDSEKYIYSIYSLEQRKKYTETLTIQKSECISSLTNVILLHDGSKALIGKEGILFQNDHDNTFIPKVMTSNMQVDQDQILVERSTGYEKTYILEMHDLNDELLWTHKMDEEDYYKTKGYLVDYTHDHTNDGYKDPVLIANRSDANVIYLPTYTLLDGKTGMVLVKNTIAIPENEITIDSSIYSSYDEYLELKGYKSNYIVNYGFMNDVNEDGYRDYYVTDSLGEIYFIDFNQNELINFYSSNSDLINENHYYDTSFASLKVIGDLNDDDFNEFIGLEVDDKYVRNLVTYSFLNDTIEKKSELFIDIDDLFSLEEDFDNDGIDDVALKISYDKQSGYIHLISSKTGEIIYNQKFSDFDKLYSSEFDINNDGIDEMFMVTSDDYKGMSHISLIDIKNERELFRSDDYRMDYFYYYEWEKMEVDHRVLKPAVIFTTNNKYFVALNEKPNMYENGENINIYDLETDTLIKTLTITKNQSEDNDRYNRNSLSYFDVIQDGEQVYFYNVSTMDKDYYYSRNEKNDVFLYHYNTNSLVFNYHNGSIEKIFIKDNQGFIKSSNQVYTTFKIEDKIAITNVTQMQKINKGIDLKFNKVNGPINIYVDDSLVGITTNDHYNLKMLEGKHSISISQTDQDGFEHVYVVDVVVTKNNFYNVFIGVTTGVIFAATLILPRRKRRFKRPVVLEEGSDLNE